MSKKKKGRRSRLNGRQDGAVVRTGGGNAGAFSGRNHGTPNEPRNEPAVCHLSARNAIAPSAQVRLQGDDWPCGSCGFSSNWSWRQSCKRCEISRKKAEEIQKGKTGVGSQAGSRATTGKGPKLPQAKTQPTVPTKIECLVQRLAALDLFRAPLPDGDPLLSTLLQQRAVLEASLLEAREQHRAAKPPLQRQKELGRMLDEIKQKVATNQERLRHAQEEAAQLAVVLEGQQAKEKKLAAELAMLQTKPVSGPCGAADISVLEQQILELQLKLAEAQSVQPEPSEGTAARSELLGKAIYDQRSGRLEEAIRRRDEQRLQEEPFRQEPGTARARSSSPGRAWTVCTRRKLFGA